MFFTMILENQSGDRIDMTTTANQYMTSKIDGLNPPAGTVSTSTYAGMDGSYLNNDFIEKQNVVIPFEMRGFDVELRRHELDRVVKPSRYIKIYYSTKNISVYAEGIVETCEVENFEKLTNGQISILCPDIYWYSTETQIAEYSRVRGAFHFVCPDNDEPFPIGAYNTQDMMTINNSGDEVGFTLEISGGPAKNPTIYNALTDEYMQISGDIQKGDVITITTKTGNKTVLLEREGVVTNIINRLVSGSTWLNLKAGENKFYVRASDGLNNIKVRLIHRNAYLGV
ncbi:MAG: phage tail family protein [Ruminococcus callidus]|uniref:phage distal tail protein n=1 Tax=Ruminococcus callidus TaxID=40519 RepID=UPI0023F57A68|nr:phage tail domain-containing protein [Ruminococcus callidus]MBS6596656.1 phage tail family protein [Ruminococcus callidus]